jgi:hypothetical protein
MKLPVQHIGRNGTRHPLACVEWQIAPAGLGPHGILPHQAFNPVKAH